MRTLVVILVISFILSTGLYSVRSARVPAQSKAAAASPQKVFEFSAKGWGKDRQEAEQDALRDAQKKLQAYLLKHKPPIHYTPSTDYIKANFKKGPAKRLDEIEGELKGINGEFQYWELSFALDSLQELALVQLAEREQERRDRLDRAITMEVRLTFFGKFLAALVAMLSAAFAYLKLEEMTKGYYTAWLRLGVVCFLVAAGASLWLLK